MSSVRVLVVLLVGGVVGGGLVYGLLRSNAPPAVATGTPPTVPAETPKLEVPPYRGLDANLFMQTSAEYRACCLQAFRWAEVRLTEKRKAKSGGKPAAVVFDLDETLLDNAAFQTKQIRTGRAFDSKLWDEWEESGGEQVGLLPGAKEFVLLLRKLEVRPVYISNRNDKFRKQTHAALERLGIDVPDEQLLLATKTSDKTERRATAAAAFDVLVMVGDNLRDFDNRFQYDQAKGMAGRAAEVDATRDKFGVDWIILPNPAYGEWTKPFPGGAKDADLLRPNQP